MSILGGTKVRDLTNAARKEATIAAQRGDETAFEALLLDVTPNLRRLVTVFQPVSADERDELEAEAARALWEAILAYRPDDDPEGVGVTAFLSEYVRKFLAEAKAARAFGAVEIPARTASRYWGVIRDAGDGAPLSALIYLAESRGMTEKTFRSVHEFVSSGPVSEVTLGASPWEPDSDLAAAEDRAVAAQALASIEGAHLEITRRSYGFHDYRPQTDAEIGHEVGMSRATVQRRRVEALGVMREAVGV